MVHVGIAHDERACGVRSRDAGVGDVEAHCAHGRVQSGGDLGLEIETFEFGDFVAGCAGCGVANEGADVCGETALPVEGEVDGGGVCCAIHADLVDGGGVVVGH